MSTRMRWDKRRPVFRPWYDLDVNPFERGAVSLARHGVMPSVKKAKKAYQAKLKPAPVRVPLERPTVVAGVLAPNYVLRTRDIAKATEALSGVVATTIWTDGACGPKNPGTMGFSAVILAAGIRVELFGGGSPGTNNRSELEAAILALTVLPDGCPATIISDSTYLVDGMEKRIHNWRVRGFKRDGGAMPNADYWRKLDALASGRSVTWRWVRGHSSDQMNQLADRLATLGRTSA